MTDIITGAIIAATSTLLGVGINSGFVLIKQSSEEKRWFTEFYLSSKLDALRHLHSVMGRNHYSLQRDLANAPRTTITEFREHIEVKEYTYLDAMTAAGVYLSEDDKKLFRSVLGSTRNMVTSIFAKIPGAQIYAGPDGASAMGTVDWKAYGDSFDAAQRRLETLLNPRVLQSVEDPL